MTEEYHFEVDHRTRRLFEQLSGPHLSVEQLRGMTREDLSTYVLAAAILAGQTVLERAAGFMPEEGMIVLGRVFPELTDDERSDVLINAQQQYSLTRYNDEHTLTLTLDSGIRRLVDALRAYNAGRPVRLSRYGDPVRKEGVEYRTNPHQMLGDWLNLAGGFTTQIMERGRDGRDKLLTSLTLRLLPEPARTWVRRAKDTERRHAAPRLSFPGDRDRDEELVDAIFEAGETVAALVLVLCKGLDPHMPSHWQQYH